MKLLFSALFAAGLATAAELSLGKPLTLDKPLTVDTLMSAPDRHLDKTVQVKGKVTEVCEKMGCWMKLVSDSGQSIRIKVVDGEIVFPPSSIGRQAIAEGKLVKLQLTRDQALARARHEAEEQGGRFDASFVKGPSTVYQIQGTGAQVLD